MQTDSFKYEFNRLNGVCFGRKYVLFRKPLELYCFETGESVNFQTLDEALRYQLNGKTLEELIAAWTKIEFVRDGGRGSSSGMTQTFKFGHARQDRGSGGGTKDLPARLNVKLNIRDKSPEGVLQEFRKLHVSDNYESGVTVDEYGYVTSYVHGGATSVAIWGKKGEIVYHNHPSGGAFSDSDLISTSMSAEKGIVASGKNGDYIFVKGTHFNPTAFVKAVKNARMQGKDYSDAVDKWLTSNQKKYGYKYVFKKAKT